MKYDDGRAIPSPAKKSKGGVNNGYNGIFRTYSRTYPLGNSGSSTTH